MSSSTNGDIVVIILGVVYFWHMEATLRRLPGVIDTEAEYSGGVMWIGNNNGNVAATTTTTEMLMGMSPPSPPLSYEMLCGGKTGHVNTVRVTLDGEMLNPRTLFDCFLSLHNPTKARAHGKQAAGTGHYRS